MHRFLFVLLLVLLTLPSLAYTHRYGNNMECLHINKGGTDEYYFCGAQYHSCAGDKANGYDDRVVYTSGVYINFDYKHWVCCGGTDSAPGVFKQLNGPGGGENTLDDTEDGLKWQNVGKGKIPYIEKTVTVDIEGGGQCTYEARFDACGTELTKPCTEPTGCTDGLVLRNGVCTEPCVGDTDFESKTSNKCVECSTTLYQGSAFVTVDNDTEETGIVSSIKKKADGTVESKKYANGSYCLKCNKNTHFFDGVTNQCVEKKELKNVDHVAMAKCGMCNNKESFEKCIRCFSGDDTSGCKAGNENECFFQD